MYYTKLPVHSALIQFKESTNKNPRFVKITSPLFQHRVVMSIFEDIPSSSPRSEMGILFRMETPPEQEPYFLIQSRVKPCNLPQDSEVIELTIPRLTNGDYVYFRVAVNARTRVGKTSKPVHVDKVPDWFIKKVSSFFDEVIFENISRRVNKDSKRVVQIDTIEGFAKVSNTELLAEAIDKGIGRETSYGCGLMSIKRA